MRFDIITIFPDVIESYINSSILKRAQDKNVIDIRVHNLRTFAPSKHSKVDGKPYGGGPGMVFMVEPIARALKQIARTKHKKNIRVIFFSPAGKQFNAKMAKRYAKREQRMIMIADHYEGVDGRAKKVVKDMGFSVTELSIGPYVLTGGELPALVVADSISRHVQTVLGKKESLEETRYGIGVPAYTRPEAFTWNGKIYRVPKVLLSGDHQKIKEWRRKHRKGA